MYKYTLIKGSKKNICPKCQKKRFVNYQNMETGKLLPPMVGRCDREINCGYHLTPKEFFKDLNIDVNFHINKVVIPEIKTPTFHPNKLINLSNKNFDKNNFIQYLKTVFNEKQTDRIISKYLIGTSTYWNGATVFWQIDTKNLIRGGKIMLYLSATGKRVKKPYNHITWVHSVLLKKKKIHKFNLDQCLFGSHLLNQDKNKPVAIVESEKTACIMSELFDKYLWLSCGSLSNLNEKMLRPIKNKNVVLYPDLSMNQKAYKEWKATSEKLNKKDFNISVSRLLEDHCSEQQREKGYDIADCFLNTSIHNTM